MITPSELAELLLRGAAVGVLVAIAAALLREARTPARLTGGLFCLGAAGHAVEQSPVIRRVVGSAVAPAWVLSIVAGGLLWAFALELFGDSPRTAPFRTTPPGAGPPAIGLRKVLYAPAAVLLALALVAVSLPWPIARWLWLAQNVINAALMVHVLIVTWAGLPGDLVEPRRRLRGPMIAAIAAYALATSGVQTAEIFSRPADELSLLAAITIVTLSLAGAVVFLRVDERLFGQPPRAATPSPSAAAPASPAVPAQDRAAFERLRRALDGEEIWRREDLTIGALAERVGVPEHRLRKIINEGLGYRNFAGFLGERRVAAAKAALADPEAARRPVSAIAFDVGFSSLSSFNRVFREIAGVSPTAFRRQALGEDASVPKNPPQN